MTLESLHEFLASFWTVWAVIIFLVIVFWALRPRNRKRFEKDARIPESGKLLQRPCPVVLENRILVPVAERSGGSKHIERNEAVAAGLRAAGRVEPEVDRRVRVGGIIGAGTEAEG